jgi:hypothetical protein
MVEMSYSPMAIVLISITVLMIGAVLFQEFRRRPEVSCVDGAHRGARRFASWVSYLFAATPVVWIGMLYSFVLHWHSFHGRWPETQSKRTTIAIELSGHESLVGITGSYMVYSFPIWAVFVLFTRHYVLTGSEGYRRAGLFFIPWALLLLLATVDPGHYITWFFE